MTELTKEGRFAIIILVIALIIGGIAFYKIYTEKNFVYLPGCAALASGDEGYCQNFFTGCPYDYYFLQAIKNSDISMCDRIIDQSEHRDITCRAIVKKDIILCSQLPEKSVARVACEAAITIDASKCGALENVPYTEIRDSPAGAVEIQLESSKFECQATAYSDIAYITGDISYCEKIKELSKLPQTYHLDNEYMYCKGAVTKDIKSCIRGNLLCFGGDESVVKCYAEAYNKRLNAQIQGENSVSNKKLREEARSKGGGDWEYYKKTHPWWWLGQ